MSAKLVPFGRYRGQPLDQMLNDQSYVEWLVKQDWFVQRFPDIHSITMNWGNPDLAQTPEHNAMQARFLEPAYSIGVLFKLLPGLYATVVKLLEMPKLGAPLHCDSRGDYYDYRLRDGTSTEVLPGTQCKVGSTTHGWNEETRGWNYKDVFVQFTYPGGFGGCAIDVDFEVGGWDIKLSSTLGRIIAESRWTDGEELPPSKEMYVAFSHEHRRYFETVTCLELKPHVSDDYPSILRQMKKNRDRVGGNHFALVAGSISSQVVSPAQIKAFFGAAGFGVLDLSEHPELEQLRSASG